VSVMLVVMGIAHLLDVL
jgi:hypothetical protein